MRIGDIPSQFRIVALRGYDPSKDLLPTRIRKKLNNVAEYTVLNNYHSSKLQSTSTSFGFAFCLGVAAWIGCVAEQQAAAVHTLNFQGMLASR
jgi:hypothetical protein